VTILELEKDSGAFTDYFVVCSGTNPRQVQAIADAVDERLEALGIRTAHKEGYKQAEWVLLDYVDFVVHIFSENARQYYDLERRYRGARGIRGAASWNAGSRSGQRDRRAWNQLGPARSAGGIGHGGRSERGLARSGRATCSQ